MSESSEERDHFVLYIVLAAIILASTLIAVKLNENENRTNDLMTDHLQGLSG